MREKGALIRDHGVCPVCADQAVAGSTLGVRHPTFECPDCGYPTHCCEDHWRQDEQHRKEVCEYLRTANEDEHDLRSGRRMSEFEFP
ncbi:translational activator for mitochondrial COX1, partial [Spiromyces aspiralis]